MGGAVEASFHWRCCGLLKFDYSGLEAETLKGGSDESLLGRAYSTGLQPTEQELEVWKAFMTKRGWRDNGTQRLNERLEEIGLPPGTVQTMFEYLDLDEGRLTPEVKKP